MPVVEQYIPEDIFTMDEIVLFYSVQSNSKLVIKGCKISWRKEKTE
jgi:hypothetical protein